MLTYKFSIPIQLDNRPQANFDNPDFIISISLTNLLQSQCSASIIEGEHFRNFFTQDLIKEETEIPYTEASIYKEICSFLVKHILTFKEKGYENCNSLAQALKTTSFSVDLQTRTIFLVTNISELTTEVKKISSRNNFTLDT